MKQSGQFILMTREEFYTYMMNLKVSRKITSIQNHHTAEPSYDDCNNSNHIQLMQNMKSYHVNQAGFSDIAQQISTYKDGLICMGRSMDKDPAGIASMNQGGICIEHIGNFDKNGDNMTDEHKKTIAYVNAVLCLKFNLPINTDTIIYHNWFGNIDSRNIKSCPGTNFIGGNTRDAAINYLYPLVATELNKLKTPIPQQPSQDDILFKENLDWLVSYGKISSPNYWIENARKGGICNGEYVRTILNRFAEFLRNMPMG